MKNKIQYLVEDIDKSINKLKISSEFYKYKSIIYGPNGKLTLIIKKIDSVATKTKPLLGKIINAYKTKIESVLKKFLFLKKDIKNVFITIDTPSTELLIGKYHPLTIIRKLIEEYFLKAGFVITYGTEIESEWFCFEALNTPKEHPARKAQNTFFLNKKIISANINNTSKLDNLILRTHTSTIQVRYLQKNSPPFSIITSGRVYRRDTIDSTHHVNFHQLEGLNIKKIVTVTELISLLDNFIKFIFSFNVKTRIRPSYFPFTKPSFEVDILSNNLGSLSNKWIEIIGCGMVEPKVLNINGINPNKWKGLAFGIGIERIAMIYYGIDDVRYFYKNDASFITRYLS